MQNCFRLLRVPALGAALMALATAAEALTLWTSINGKKWEEAWSVEKVERAWDVLLENPAQARFLKLGLDRDAPEHFHLEAFDIYGVRPEEGTH